MISLDIALGRHVMHISFKVKYCHKVFEYEPARKLCETFFNIAEEMK